MNFTFEDSLNSDFIYNYDRLRKIHNNLLKVLKSTYKTFNKLNINQEKIKLKQIYYIKKAVNIEDLKLNIKNFENYISYLDNINYILLIHTRKNNKYVSRVDKYIDYLIFG